MASPTSGPWEVDRRATTRVFKSDEPNRGICSAGGYVTSERDVTEENEANARLIAASPTMLAAIDKAIGPLCMAIGELRDCEMMNLAKVLGQVKDELSAAIARATGEPT